MAGSPLRASAQSSFTDSVLIGLRRSARSFVLRGAVSGRISWIGALQLLALLDGGAQ